MRTQLSHREKTGWRFKLINSAAPAKIRKIKKEMRQLRWYLSLLHTYLHDQRPFSLSLLFPLIPLPLIMHDFVAQQATIYTIMVNSLFLYNMIVPRTSDDDDRPNKG
jgi:hypothetical protein